jgi:hypothetical protein
MVDFTSFAGHQGLFHVKKPECPARKSGDECPRVFTSDRQQVRVAASPCREIGRLEARKSVRGVEEAVIGVSPHDRLTVKKLDNSSGYCYEKNILRDHALV